MKQVDLFGQVEVDHKDAETMVCYSCEKEQPLEAFPKLVYASGAVEYKRRCKACGSYHSKLIGLFKRQHPIDHDTHNCDICGTTLEEITRGPKYFVVDHCHKTETFRGWICSSCNTGIGALGDDPETVRKALDYLEKHQG